MTNVVEVDAASREFGGDEGLCQALDGVSLNIPDGEFVSILGPSGCGKSTLLNLIAGYDEPTSGTIRVTGLDLAGMSDGERSHMRLHDLGFVFQNFNLLPRLSVEENVSARLRHAGAGRHEARGQARKMLDEVGVPSRAWTRYPGQLSGGEQQRVSMARGLITNPRLLLADEPTGNLDSTTGERILSLLRRLNVDRKMSVVMVTHDQAVGASGHRTIELRDGKVLRDVGSVPAVAPVVSLVRDEGGK